MVVRIFIVTENSGSIINVGVCEKISVSLIFYDKFLGWRMPQSFSGNHPALAAL